jgi:inner membrane protein
MIFFGHLGITTACVKLYESTGKKEKISYKSKHTKIDYRMVFIGSMLPDIIDKPIGGFFFRNYFHNSRLFGHSLIFSITLILLGTYLNNYKKTNKILLIGAASLIHQILDSMWVYPRILYWPFLGLKFPKRVGEGWIKHDIIKLLTDPRTFMPEVIGGLILLYYFIKLYKKRRICNFIKNGEL